MGSGSGRIPLKKVVYRATFSEPLSTRIAVCGTTLIPALILAQSDASTALKLYFQNPIAV
jgi:hypothetical protein